MLFSLSTNVIVDTIHAIAALETLRGRCGNDASALRPLLDRERSGPLRLLVKNAFAETVMRLLPYVTDTCLDNEKPDAAPGHQEVDAGGDILLQIELRIPEGFHASGASSLRRNLEFAVSSHVIETVLTGSCDANSDSRTADIYAQRYHETVSYIITLLRTPSQPLLRSRSY